MLGHTRRHHTESHHTEKSFRVEKIQEVDLPISVDDYIRDCFGDLPKWAVALRGLRNREGLTQAVLGEMLGTPQTNISKMEMGKRAIGKNMAKKLANLFKIDYRLFL